MEFTDALKHGNLEAVRSCPKADLHNHFVLGGSRRFLLEHTGKDIQPLKSPLGSMDEMHAWNAQNIGADFETPEGRRMLIRAAFSQAKEDGVTVLEIGEDFAPLTGNNDLLSVEDDNFLTVENPACDIACKPSVDEAFSIDYGNH